MAKLPGKIIVEAQNVGKVQTMIELLHKHKDDLPVELMDSLNELADCDACEIGIDRLEELGINHCKVDCFIDNELFKGVISANKILKRVSTLKGYIYPDKFKLMNGDSVVVGW